jgi:hypothetical protein
MAREWTMRKELAIRIAREKAAYYDENEVSVEDDAKVAEAGVRGDRDPGAVWVSAWIYVSPDDLD